MQDPVALSPCHLVTLSSSRRQLARKALAALLPRSRFLVRGPADSGAVCLTFDDGPHPVHTARLLDVLHEHHVPATFFVVGREAEHYPDLVRRLAAEGHAVGHHSYSHGEPAQTSARQLLDEVRRCRALLGTLLPETPDLFRPPRGKVTVAKLWRLWRAGQTVVLWSVDPRDYTCADAAELRARLGGCTFRAGDILLFHDNQPHAADAMPDLVAAVRAQGLKFTTLQPWVGRRRR